MHTHGRNIVFTFFGAPIPERVGTEELHRILAAIDGPFREGFRKREGRDATDEEVYIEQERIVTFMSQSQAGHMVAPDTPRQAGEPVVPRIVVREAIPGHRVIFDLKMLGLIKEGS